MSDEQNTAGVLAVPEKRPGFLATSTGKIVSIVVGLAVLGIVAGIAVAIVLFVFGSEGVEEMQGQAQEQPTTGSASGSTTAASPATAEAPAVAVANAEVFTFRDIFIPLIKPRPVSTGGTTSGGGTGGSTGGSTTATSTTDPLTPTTKGTLYLDGVVTENGVMKAVMRYDGVTYTLAVGGPIPGSPWQVLRVSATSVTMLYGDTQVVLSVGQGITK